MTDIKMGDTVLCMRADGVESTGLRAGSKYTANTVMNIPGQGEYVGVVVEEKGQIVIVEASRFEKAHILKFRIWVDGSYALMNEDFKEKDYIDNLCSYSDVTLTLPESQLEYLTEAITSIVKVMKAQEGARNETSH